MRQIIHVLGSIVLVLSQTSRTASASPPVYAHNMAAVTIADPPSGSVLRYDATIQAKFSNTGTSDLSNVIVCVAIKNESGSYFYRDTETIASINSGQTKTVDFVFNHFSGPAGPGWFAGYAIVLDSLDENRSDDTAQASWFLGYESEAVGDSVVFPANQQSILEKTSFRAIGILNSIGMQDLYYCPVRVQVRRCSDGQLAFQADTNIPALYYKIPTTIRFPSSQGIYDSQSLLPGCYRIAVIARWPTDGDRTDDTSYSQFIITPNKLSDDMAADSILSPATFYPTAPPTIPVIVRVTNTGLNTRSSVPLVAEMRDMKGKSVYSSTKAITNWASGETRDISLNDVGVLPVGVYSVRAYLQTTSDTYRIDDTARLQLRIGYRFDVAAIKLLSPRPMDTVVIGAPVWATASFKWKGSDTSLPGPVGYNVDHVLFHLINCSGGQIVLEGNAPLPRLSMDNDSVTLALTTTNTTITSGQTPIEPGCYSLIVNCQDDDNPSNDTLTSTVYYGLASDIRCDSILYPIDGSHIDGGPVVVVARVSNYGLLTVDSATIGYALDDYTHPIPTREGYDTIVTNWKPGVPKIITFPAVFPSGSGSYQVSLYGVVASGFTYGFVQSSVAESSSDFNEANAFDNYPNPFSGVTDIWYKLPDESRVSLRVMDVTGREVRLLFGDEEQPSGEHTETIDLSKIATGVYFAELTTIDHRGSLTRKLRKLNVFRP